MRACFPNLKRWEEETGSVTKGFWRYWQEKKKQARTSLDVPGLPMSAMFSFQRGMEQLPQTLLAKTPATIHYNQEITEVVKVEEGFVVNTKDKTYEADILFCALPVKETGALFERYVPDAAKEFAKVFSEGIAVINVGYDFPVLPVQGFGYLTPTYANEDILGVVFDSCVFPHHNKRLKETRLTIKIGETGKSEECYIDEALRGIRRHLGISQIPKAISFKRASAAIPQYGVGHLEKMNDVLNAFKKDLPGCHLVGNYLRGVSVDQCVARAKEAVGEFLLTQKNRVD